MRRLALLLAITATAPGLAHAGDKARSNYLLACRGCHLEDGRGVPPEVPSLRETLGRFAADPAARDYLVRVPGVAQSRLNDEDLAEVVNWVLTEFNAQSLPPDFTPLSVSEVAAARVQKLADPKAYRNRLLEALTAE